MKRKEKYSDGKFNFKIKSMEFCTTIPPLMRDSCNFPLQYELREIDFLQKNWKENALCAITIANSLLLIVTLV